MLEFIIFIAIFIGLSLWHKRIEKNEYKKGLLRADDIMRDAHSKDRNISSWELADKVHKQLWDEAGVNEMVYKMQADDLPHLVVPA